MPNKQGARCIHTAAQRGHISVVNSILTKGEHVDATTNVSKYGWFKFEFLFRINKLNAS